MLEPLDFIARLAALVPKWRVIPARYHGVFAPNSRWRQQVTPARRGQGNNETKTAAHRQRAMSWVQHSKRVFEINVETRNQCSTIVMHTLRSGH